MNFVFDKFKIIEVISFSLLINVVNFYYEIYMLEGFYYIIFCICEGCIKVFIFWKDLNMLFKGFVILICYLNVRNYMLFIFEENEIIYFKKL